MSARSIAAAKVQIMTAAEVLVRATEIEAQVKGKAGSEAAARLSSAHAIRSFADAIERGDPFIFPDTDSEYTAAVQNLFISRCFVCRRPALWLLRNLIYPRRSMHAPEPNPDLPADVRDDYSEAAEVLAVSPRAAAALLRLAIEKLCSHIVGRSGGIDEMIAELVRGGLSDQVQQALDIVRVIGNESVHPGTMDLRDDVDTARALFGLVNFVAEEMISRKTRLQALYATLPPAKLEGIDQRNQRALARPKPAQTIL